MDFFLNLLCQYLLGPAMRHDLLQIPSPLQAGQLGLQDDHVLRPSDLHSQVQRNFVLAVYAVEVPHPAKVPGRKTRNIGATFLQVFRGSNSGTLFFSGTDSLPDQGIHLHLRVIAGNGFIQYSIHVAVISGLANIHGLPPFQNIIQGKEKRSRKAAFFSVLISQDLHGLLPELNVSVLDDLIVVIMAEQPVVEL